MAQILVRIESATFILSEEFVTNHFTDSDIVGNGWVMGGINTPSHHFFSDCGGDRILGGYGVVEGDPANPSYFLKNWINLPPHY